MKTRPITRYRHPVYPTRLEVLDRPDLLERHLPPTWRCLPEMAGATAMFLAVNASLKAAEPKSDTPAQVTIVAPLFEHGEGRGATGCVVVSPPVFLSEEEAFQVINEEMSKHGIHFSQTNSELKGVTAPCGIYHTMTAPNGTRRAIKPRERLRGNEVFRMDAIDSRKKIAVEFVSERDHRDTCSPNSEETKGGGWTVSTVGDYEFKMVAGFTADHLKTSALGDMRVGVFYDPCPRADSVRPEPGGQPADWQAYWRERQTKATAESRRLLRLQVQDFVKWLQGQGVI